MVTHGHGSGPPAVRFLYPAFHYRLANGRVLSPMLPEIPDLGFGVHPGQTVNSSQDHALAEPVQDRVRGGGPGRPLSWFSDQTARSAGSGKTGFSAGLVPTILERSRRQRLHVLNLQDPPHQRFRYPLALGNLSQGHAQILPHPVNGAHSSPRDAPAPPDQLALRPGPVPAPA